MLLFPPKSDKDVLSGYTVGEIDVGGVQYSVGPVASDWCPYVYPPCPLHRKQFTYQYVFPLAMSHEIPSVSCLSFTNMNVAINASWHDDDGSDSHWFVIGE